MLYQNKKAWAKIAAIAVIGATICALIANAKNAPRRLPVSEAPTMVVCDGGRSVYLNEAADASLVSGATFVNDRGHAMVKGEKFLVLRRLPGSPQAAYFVPGRTLTLPGGLRARIGEVCRQYDVEGVNLINYQVKTIPLHGGGPSADGRKKSWQVN